LKNPKTDNGWIIKLWCIKTGVFSFGMIQTIGDTKNRIIEDIIFGASCPEKQLEGLDG